MNHVIAALHPPRTITRYKVQEKFESYTIHGASSHSETRKCTIMQRGSGHHHIYNRAPQAAVLQGGGQICIKTPRIWGLKMGLVPRKPSLSLLAHVTNRSDCTDKLSNSFLATKGPEKRRCLSGSEKLKVCRQDTYRKLALTSHPTANFSRDVSCGSWPNRTNSQQRVK